MKKAEKPAPKIIIETMLATGMTQAEAAEQIAAQTDPLRTASWILVLIDGLYSRLTDLNYPIDNQAADLKHLIRQLTAAR